MCLPTNISNFTRRSLTSLASFSGFFGCNLSCRDCFLGFHQILIVLFSSVSTADLDGDGDLDIVSASRTDGRIVWFENTDGAGTFAVGADIAVFSSAGPVVAADLDNDGDMDLVVFDQGEFQLVWYENTDGKASFSSAVQIDQASPGVSRVSH